MLVFCAEHNITSDIEIIAMKDINEAYERMIKGDVKYVLWLIWLRLKVS